MQKRRQQQQPPQQLASSVSVPHLRRVSSRKRSLPSPGVLPREGEEDGARLLLPRLGRKSYRSSVFDPGCARRNPYDADGKLCFTAGETVDRLVSDGVLGEREGKRVRMLLAAENRRMYALLQAYEREGNRADTVLEFRVGVTELLARFRTTTSSSSSSKKEELVGKEEESCTTTKARCLPSLAPFNVDKIWGKVAKILTKCEPDRDKVLLVGSGTFNPVHKLHLRFFYTAKHFLEECGMQVVGGVVSPSHPTLVRQRHRSRPSEVIPPKHRLAMVRKAVGESSWLTVDPWEITRRRIMDYMSVLEHVKASFQEAFPEHSGGVRILYLCEASQVVHLNPQLLRQDGFGVVTVCRPLDCDKMVKELRGRFRDIGYVIEDAAILDASTEKISSRVVRELLKEGKSVEAMVGASVERYIVDHDLASKITGDTHWTPSDKAFDFEKDDRPYLSIPKQYNRRVSQLPLTY